MKEHFNTESLLMFTGSTFVGLGVWAMAQAPHILSAEEQQSLNDYSACLATVKVGDNTRCLPDSHYPSQDKRDLPDEFNMMGFMASVTGLGLAAFGAHDKRKVYMQVEGQLNEQQRKQRHELDTQDSLQTAQKLRELIRESYIKEFDGPIKPWPEQEDL